MSKERNPEKDLKTELALSGLFGGVSGGMEYFNAKNKHANDLINEIIESHTFTMPTAVAAAIKDGIGQPQIRPDNIDERIINHYQPGDSEVRDRFMKLLSIGGTSDALDVTSISPNRALVAKDVLEGLKSAPAKEKLLEALSNYGKPALKAFAVAAGGIAIPAAIMYLAAKMGERDQKQLADNIKKAAADDVAETEFLEKTASILATIINSSEVGNV